MATPIARGRLWSNSHTYTATYCAADDKGIVSRINNAVIGNSYPLQLRNWARKNTTNTNCAGIKQPHIEQFGPLLIVNDKGAEVAAPFYGQSLIASQRESVVTQFSDQLPITRIKISADSRSAWTASDTKPHTVADLNRVIVGRIRRHKRTVSNKNNWASCWSAIWWNSVASVGRSWFIGGLEPTNYRRDHRLSNWPNNCVCDLRRNKPKEHSCNYPIRRPSPYRHFVDRNQTPRGS